ncbi:MAG: hypothetical protein WCI18_15585 [Pseudomonadota bacterium]
MISKQVSHSLLTASFLDPSNRLDHFQALKEKLEKEAEKQNNANNKDTYIGSGAGGYATVMARRRRKGPITIPAVYEWDIHPGDVSKKLLPTPPSKDNALISGHISTIGVTGTFSTSAGTPFLQHDHRNHQYPPENDYAGSFAPKEAVYTDSVYQPKITLLINNFVKSKVLPPQGRIIDPNSIHRVPSRQEGNSVQGDYQSILNSVQATIPIPEYGTYDLKRNHPLPKIVKSELFQ